MDAAKQRGGCGGAAAAVIVSINSRGSHAAGRLQQQHT
jgi:hypothetical protein